MREPLQIINNIVSKTSESRHRAITLVAVINRIKAGKVMGGPNLLASEIMLLFLSHLFIAFSKDEKFGCQKMILGLGV